MTVNTNPKFDTLGKEGLRAACREAGVQYGKLNNDGMRAALVAHYAPASAIPTTARRNVFAQVALGTSPPIPDNCGTGIRVVDGKRVDPTETKKKGTSEKPEKMPAPVMPRASRKGYKIQKNRIEQNGVRRPSEGTVCGSVWAEFDKSSGIKASDLQELADVNGWNRTNVSCEFYAWRKFMGIKGRS